MLIGSAFGCVEVVGGNARYDLGVCRVKAGSNSSWGLRADNPPPKCRIRNDGFLFVLSLEVELVLQKKEGWIRMMDSRLIAPASVPSKPCNANLRAV